MDHKSVEMVVTCLLGDESSRGWRALIEILEENEIKSQQIQQ